MAGEVAIPAAPEPLRTTLTGTAGTDKTGVARKMVRRVDLTRFKVLVPTLRAELADRLMYQALLYTSTIIFVDFVLCIQWSRSFTTGIYNRVIRKAAIHPQPYSAYIFRIRYIYLVYTSEKGRALVSADQQNMYMLFSIYAPHSLCLLFQQQMNRSGLKIPVQNRARRGIDGTTLGGSALQDLQRRKIFVDFILIDEMFMIGEDFLGFMSTPARQAAERQTGATSEGRGCSAVSTSVSWQTPCNHRQRALHLCGPTTLALLGPRSKACGRGLA